MLRAVAVAVPRHLLMHRPAATTCMQIKLSFVSRRLRQMEAALAGLPDGSVNPEKLARAGEALAALRDQLTDLRAAEIVLCPKARSRRPTSHCHGAGFPVPSPWFALAQRPGSNPCAECNHRQPAQDGARPRCAHCHDTSSNAGESTPVITEVACFMQVDDAAKWGRPLEAAEVRVQLEAHGRTVAKWLGRAAKLLERVQGLRLRSESPGEGSHFTFRL